MTIARSIASLVAKPIARPVASVGGGGTRALDIRASVGTSTSPTNSAPNLLQHTEDFSNAVWGKLGGTVTVNDAVAPNGTTTADRIVFSAGNQYVKQDVSKSSSATTQSIYVKGTAGETINLSNFTNYSEVKTLTGGWDRISITATVGNCSLSIDTYNGATARTIWVWGAQLEAASSATTYIAHPVINKAVTGVGFQPKAILGVNVQHTASTTTTVALLSLGAAVSTSSRAAIAVSSNNAVTTSATNRRHTNAGMLTGLNATGTVQSAADLASLDADGFTRNFSIVSGAAEILNHICLGGADLEVSLTQQQMNGTNAAQSFAHGLSGAPTGVLFFSGIYEVAPPTTVAGALCSIGAWAGGNQFSAIAFSASAQTTTQTRRALFTTGACGWTIATMQRLMAVSSVDATNVNVTYPVTTATGQAYFFMLAIRGAKCQVGTFDPFGGSTIATTGITPKLFLPVMVPTGVTLAGTVNNILNLSIGASDGTNNVSCGITDNNGVTTTNARRFQSSSSLCQYDATGLKQFEATAAFSGESVVLTRSTNNQYYGEMGYLVIGV